MTLSNRKTLNFTAETPLIDISRQALKMGLRLRAVPLNSKPKAGRSMIDLYLYFADLDLIFTDSVNDSEFSEQPEQSSEQSIRAIHGLPDRIHRPSFRLIHHRAGGPAFFFSGVYHE